MRFLETLEFASRIFSASGSFALKLMQRRWLNTQLQKAQKRVLTG